MAWACAGARGSSWGSISSVGDWAPGVGMATPWTTRGDRSSLLAIVCSFSPHLAEFGPEGPSFPTCMTCISLGSEPSVTFTCCARPALCELSAVCRSHQPLRCVSKVRTCTGNGAALAQSFVQENTLRRGVPDPSASFAGRVCGGAGRVPEGVAD